MLTELYVQEVLDAAEEKKDDLKKFVTRLVEKIDNNRNLKKNGNVDVEDIINGSYENGFL